MKKFIVNTSFFLSLVVGAYALISFLPDTMARNTYMAAIVDKHHRIDSIATPKIIFAGGSNIAFGINSQRIEKEFCVPVVNLSLHAGLGTSFILEELRRSVKTGDQVFISFEYFLGSVGDYKLKKITADAYPSSRDYFEKDIWRETALNVDNARSKVRHFFSTSQHDNETSQNDDQRIYARDAFNKYGDVISHLNGPIPGDLKDRVVYKYEYWQCIEDLSAFSEFAANKNVKVYYLFPCIASTEYDKNKLAITALAADLSKTTKLEILNTPTDFVYDDVDFFDTIYHLNAKGREKRTTRLIDILEKNRHFMADISAIRQKKVCQ